MIHSYIDLAQRTVAGRIHPYDPNLLHAAIGIMTETVEMEVAPNRENFLEELGDTMWYVALACHTLHVTLVEAMDTAAPAAGLLLTVQAAEILDLMKKALFYGKTPEATDLVGRLGRLILDLQAECIDGNFELILAQNIAKLQKRYPDKFTEERAINR